MKHLIPITIGLFLIFISPDAQAQYASIFGQTSTQWVFEWHNLEIDEQDTVYVSKDTFAFGHNWKKIGLKKYPNFFSGALVREDTTIGKVWYKGLEFNNSIDDTLEFLAFDFDLNKNDTFNIDNMYAGKFGTSTFENTVDSVYYINDNKYIRFNWILYAGFPFTEKFTLIESIGGIMGILFKQYSGGLQAQYLLCAYKDGVQTFYQNKRHNGNCNIYGANGINEIKKNKDFVAIYPNPSNDKLNVELKSNSYQIKNSQIMDMLGRIINSNGSIKKLNISNLPNGIYQLKIILNNNVQINKTFQKQ
jgi:hypothetical protein